MSENLAIITSIIGIIGSIYAACHVLLAFYFRKEQETANLKHNLVMEQIGTLKESTGRLEKTISIHTENLQKLTIAANNNYTRYNAQTDSIKASTDMFKDTAHDLKKDISEVRSIAVHLSNELMMIKTRK